MKNSWKPSLLVALAIGVWACGGGKESSTSETTYAGDDKSKTGTNQPSNPPASKPPASTPPRTEPEKPREPEMVTRVMVVPTGEEILASLGQEISTKDDKAGQTFTASTKEAVKVNGVTVLPAGSTIHGEVTRAKRAANLGGDANMTLEFKQVVTPDGKSHPLLAEPLVLEGKSTTQGDVEKIVGGAVGGAIIGGVLGGKKGAIKGAAAGTAAGTVYAVATKGKDIVLEPGRELAVVLTREVRIPVTYRSDQLP